MSEPKGIGLAGLALLPIVCCLGLPLLLAGGLGIAAFALIGGIAVGALAVAAVVALLAVRRRRRRACANARSDGGPLVEILYFDGCPNHHPAVALVEHVSGELGIEPDLRLVNVPDQEAAQRLRFLGSPTIRVGGVDVEPRAEERDDYALSCRLFETQVGVRGQPDERWVREALLREAGVSA